MHSNRWVLITGSARRIGAILALGLAKRGFNIVIHHGHSVDEAQGIANAIHHLGRESQIIQADLENPQAAAHIIFKAIYPHPLYALINNAAIFLPEKFEQVTQSSWDEHIRINLSAPLFLSQEFTRYVGKNDARIINILDWRALRPGLDHFSYTISKAGLAAMTKSLARALAPQITVNGLALGAVLPPADGNLDFNITKLVPMDRWADAEEIVDVVDFLISGPTYITGEIIHLDGGRHLV